MSTNIVYVHGYTEDRKVREELIRFFSQVRDSCIDGLEQIHPVVSPAGLTRLAHEYGLADEVLRYPFSGLGIWTEWTDERYID